MDALERDLFAPLSVTDGLFTNPLARWPKGSRLDGRLAWLALCWLLLAVDDPAADLGSHEPLLDDWIWGLCVHGDVSAKDAPAVATDWGWLDRARRLDAVPVWVMILLILA